MKLTRLALSLFLMVGIVPLAHASHGSDDGGSFGGSSGSSELPAPDFGWITLAVLAAGGAGLMLVRRQQAALPQA